MTLTQTVDRLLRQALEKSPELGNPELENLLRLLAKWRHTLITNTLIAQQGNVVQAGPFTGLRFTGQTSEGCTAPRLLGWVDGDNEALAALLTVLEKQPSQSVNELLTAAGLATPPGVRALMWLWKFDLIRVMPG